MTRILFGLGLGLFLAGPGTPSRAAEPTAVKITVTDTVVRAKAPRIGFNVCQNPFDDKSTLLENCLNPNPGLEEGVVCRHLVVTSAGDAMTFEEPTAGNDEYRKIVVENFWKDADFRVLDGKASGRKGKIVASAYGDKKTTYSADGSGPAFAAGDLILIEQPNAKSSVNVNWKQPAAGNVTQAFVAEDDHAPFHGGKNCLKIDAKAMPKGEACIWLPTFKRWGGGRGGDREGNADRFLQEKTYRVTLWAKGTPGAKGSVRFVASSETGNAEPDDFVLTDTWKKYELIRKSNAMVNLVIVLTGGDEMFLDDFVVSEDDGGEPLAILPRVADALADLKPGTLRLLSGARGESLDNWMAHPLERLRTLQAAAYPRWEDTPDQPNLPDGLNLCERAGASPWLVMGLAMTDEEWDHLMEYLAGPAETPYGAKRAAQGQPESWLKTFDKIYLELGDEAWNKANKAKAPWAVVDAPRYTAWAEHVFSRVKKSPYYSDKIRLVAGGNAGDAKWNETVLKGCPSLDVLSCTGAIGGAESIAAQNADTATMQSRLLAYPVAKDLPQLTAAAQMAKAAGTVLALGGCETVSNEQSFLGPERSMLRSESAAVAVLDELVLAVAGGSEAAEFSRFAQGSDNATHVDAHEMALHPAAQGIRLYNRYAGGMDLVTATLATPAAPLAAYAFKGTGGYSVLLINRSPNESYQATVALPAGGGKVHGQRIASDDPLANNLNAIQVKTEEFDGDASQGIAVPAHSIVMVETQEVAK